MFIGVLLSLSGATTTGPAPTNPLQRALYSLAKGLSNTFDPAPGPGSPTVGTPDPVSGAVAGSLGFTTGDGLTFTATGASQGIVTVTYDGTYTYTPTEVARQAATGSTTDNFVATVHSGLSTRSVTVVVPVDPGTPVAGTASVNSPDQTTGVVTGSAKFTDTAGRSLTYSVVTTSTGGGTVSIDAATGQFTYTPTHAQRLSDVIADTFTVTASNGLRAAAETVTVTVLGTSANNAPIAGNDTFTGIKGISISGNVLTNDSDPDGDPLSAALATGPSHGSVNVNSNGSFTYTPTTNYVGNDSFSYIATDGLASSTPATANITVKEDNTGSVTVSFATNYPSTNEGNSGTTTVPLTVQLSEASTQTITVNYTVGSGLDSATAGEDFQSTHGTLTFTPGQTQATIPVAIYGDTTYENDERVYVFLNSATNAIIGATTFTSVTIQNDDTGGVTAASAAAVVQSDAAVERSAAAQTAAMARASSANDSTNLSLDLIFNGFNSSIGWVPFVGTAINAAKIAVDTLELVTAAVSLNAERVGNEIGQIVADTIGLIPVIGAPVASLIYDIVLGGDAKLGALVQKSLQSYFDADSTYAGYQFHFDSVAVTPALLGKYSGVATVSTPTHEGVSVAVDITNTGLQTGWSVPLQGRLALLALEWDL